ncbi:MAG: PfkB family carbohydrate kinase [Bacillota bacterium]|nr:PfkB family carbohydrate kinase [Bacillota bacterium]
MRLITVGDNVTDCYISDGLYYPGGQAVNVAVNAKRDGALAVNYLGIFGNDDRADFILSCLNKEGVTTLRSRRVYAHTAQPGVRISTDGDRVFVSGPRDSCQHLFALSLTREDYELIRSYDVCHTTNQAHIESQLPQLSREIPVSFDFSDRRGDAYLKAVCPYLKYAFFSGSDMGEEEVLSLIESAHALGTGIVCVTRGTLGSVVSDGKKVYRQGIKKVETVDTMGAGDAYIAAFLTRFADGGDMEASLDYASERSAYTCTIRGGFGYPHIS